MQTNNDNHSASQTRDNLVNRNDISTPSTIETPVTTTSTSQENAGEAINEKRARRKKQRQVCCENFTYGALLALIGEIQQQAHLGPQGYINLLLFRYLLHKKQEEAEARRKEKEEQEAKALAKSARKIIATDLSTLPGTPSKSSAHGHR